MSRVNVYGPVDTYDAAPLAGWFESVSAEHWSDRDYNGNGSGGTGRGQSLWRTAGGKWVLEHWSAWQGEDSTYAYISDDEARDWLLRNEEDASIAKHFGDIPEKEDRRPGRPAVGEPVNVRLGDDLLRMVDQYAASRSISRAEAIRRLTQDAVVRARVAASSPHSPRVNY